MRFLGLTRYFRSLIKDYTRIVAPLTDLQRNLDMLQPSSKTGRRRYHQLLHKMRPDRGLNPGPPKFRPGALTTELLGQGILAYLEWFNHQVLAETSIAKCWITALQHQYLRDRKLDVYWTTRHDRVFVKLKRVLTTDPVLRAPKFDGTPFMLTTDGCKDEFGAVLSQEFTTTLDNGETVTKLHLIGFASKCTSPAEERYKPYVLEFVTLKFGFNHFSHTIWGFPVQVETDCIALWDTLCNDKLSLVHARWRDGISAYQITEVRHRPGKTNAAVDALSRRLIGREQTAADGSSWVVSKDWESSKGLVNNMFGVSDEQTLTKL